MKHLLLYALIYGLCIVSIMACGRSTTVDVGSQRIYIETVVATTLAQSTVVPSTHVLSLPLPDTDVPPGATSTPQLLSTASLTSTGDTVLETTVTSTTILGPVVTQLPTPGLQNIVPDLSPNPEGAVMGEVPPAIMHNIMDDVMQRTGATRTAVVEVIGVFTTWNDGSLGCPQPGMAYTQASVDGYHIILQVSETRYDYRVSDRGAFFLCSAQPSSSSPSQGEMDQFLIYGQIGSAEDLASGEQTPDRHRERVIQAATEHLAARIGMEAAAITLVSIQDKEVVITAPCGGGFKQEQGIQGAGLGLGYVIVLQVNATQYHYVATATLGYYCGEL